MMHLNWKKLSRKACSSLASHILLASSNWSSVLSPVQNNGLDVVQSLLSAVTLRVLLKSIKTREAYCGTSLSQVWRKQ